MVASTEHDFPRTSPERQGVASSALLRWVEALASQLNEIHSLMLLRHGQVIAEGWWSPYAPQLPHQLFSVSKSFTSTAVGLAITEGHFALDDAVLSFFPESADMDASDALAAMQVRHLLTMSTGQAVEPWTTMVSRPDGDWIRGFFEVPVVHSPGTHFLYNTGATYMLSAIVQRTTGMRLLDYLTPRLFEPLGIAGATWSESPQGITAGGIGLSLKTEDVAKFGQLYLQQGQWQGQQLIPATWVEQATRAQVACSGMNADWMQGYGYQFWRSRHGAYRGDGVFGQFCVVMPEQDAVLVITGGLDIFDMQQPLDLVWDMLLPALEPHPLPADPAAHARLTDTLSSLHLPPMQGKATSPMQAQVAGRSYAVEANALAIETLALDFDATGGTVSIHTASGHETLAWGYGAWVQGKTALFRQDLLFERTPIASSGAWTGEDSLTLVVRLVETPFYHTLTFHFGGADVLLEVAVNVSLESMQPLLLTASSG